MYDIMVSMKISEMTAHDAAERECHCCRLQPGFPSIYIAVHIGCGNEMRFLVVRTVTSAKLSATSERHTLSLVGAKPA